MKTKSLIATSLAVIAITGFTLILYAIWLKSQSPEFIGICGFFLLMIGYIGVGWTSDD